MSLGSPGLEIIETDFLVPLVDASLPIAAYAGNFSKGPMNIHKPIGTVEDFIEVFGLPNDANYNDWFQVYNYLQYDNGAIYVNRIGGTDEKPDVSSFTFMIPKPNPAYTWSLKVNQQDYDIESNDIVSGMNTLYPHTISEFRVCSIGNFLLFINKSKSFELDVEVYTNQNVFNQNSYFCGVEYTPTSAKFKLAKYRTNYRWITWLWLYANKNLPVQRKCSIGVEVNGVEVDQHIFDEIYDNPVYQNGFPITMTYREVFDVLMEKIGVVKNHDYYYDLDVLKTYYPNSAGTEPSYKTIRFFPKGVHQRFDMYYTMFWNKRGTELITRSAKV